MKKILLLLILFGYGFTANAEEETLKIYPTDDGFTLLYDGENQRDWNEARTYTGNLSINPVTEDDNVGVRSDANNNGLFRIYRNSMSFDTSIIPSSAIILSASLNVYKENAGNNNGDTRIVFTSHNRLSSTTLQKEDWYLSNYGTHQFSREILKNDQYTVFNLNQIGLEYIKNDDITIFGGMSEFDFDNIPQATAIRSASFYAMEHGTSTAPYLEVTYIIPDQPNFISLSEDVMMEISNDIEYSAILPVYQGLMSKIVQAYERGHLVRSDRRLERFQSYIREGLGRLLFTKTERRAINSLVNDMRDILVTEG